LNCVLIIVDSWRKDHCGCYGNEWIQTPHLDALAAESVLFTRAYPESLPTLPVRRALHTGTRTYPFWGHREFKGDFVGAPGWGPIPEKQDTVAELLSKQGYRTALYTDTYHQFKPSKNYARGFQEWSWIRGQENDPYRSGPQVSDEEVFRHLPSNQRDPGRVALFRRYLTNVAGRQSEEDYFPAQVFRGGADWLQRNQDAEKFFLVLDSFDPHEPWDPPEYYRRLYDDSGEEVVDAFWAPYGAADVYSSAELKRLRANYAGECTLVDRWLGHFMEGLRVSGRLEDTAVALISDHGHNLGDNGLVGKQGHPLTRAVGDLIMMIRMPDGEGAGTLCDGLCYNFDLTTTLLGLLEDDIPEQMQEGRDLRTMWRGEAPGREYVTVAWGPEVTMIDDRWWCNANLSGDHPLLFALQEDPELAQDLAESHPAVVARAVELFQEDAGGDYPEYLKGAAGMPGCSPILETGD
jgi:arylsulfatase A-like enzyme